MFMGHGFELRRAAREEEGEGGWLRQALKSALHHRHPYFDGCYGGS